MANPVPPLTHLLRQLAPDGHSVPDGELLRRYADHRDEAAFELLLWRHGGMVWGVCRRVAPDQAAAEDAFQAAALALARHAGAVRGAGSVAGWLYRVAHRAALAVRPRRREEPVARVPDCPDPGPDPAESAAARELARVIDGELSRLPETFRLPLVLCELEGRSNAEAAALLGCPVGTVESRLTRARARLRDRLSRRGVALSLGALTAAQVPGTVRAAAVRAAADPASAPDPVRALAARAAGAAGAGPLRAAGLIFVGLTALALGLAVATWPRPAIPPPELPDAGDRGPQKPADNVQARPAVLARLGSARFRHAGPVFHAAFAPDGKRLATASLGSVCVWETATGRLLHQLKRPHFPFHRVAFTPDGKTLYVVAGPTREGCELLTLDAKAQQRGRVVIRNVLYQGAEFSPDAARLAVFSMQVQGEAILMDPASGQQLARRVAPWRGTGFTPDGKRLILADGNEVIELIDATTGKSAGKLKPDDWRPQWVRFTRAGDILFAGWGWVRRWDPKRRAPAWRIELLPSGRGLEVSPDGRRVAHVSQYGITMLDVATGKEAFRVRGDAFTSATFSPDGQALALTGLWGVVALHDGATGKPLPQSPEIPGPVGGLTFTPDGGRLIADAGQRWVRWDLTPAVPDPRPAPLAELAVLAPNGHVAVRPSSSNRAASPVELVDPESGKRLRRLDPPETGETVVITRAANRVPFSGDGRRFVGFRRSPRGLGDPQTDLGLAVWDVATGKRIAEWPRGKPVASAAAVSPDGKAVAVLVPAPGSLAVWEPDTGRFRWARKIGSAISFVTFTCGGSRLVVQEIYLPPMPGVIGPPPPTGSQPLFVLDALTGKEILKAHGPVLGMHPYLFVDQMFHLVPCARAVSPDGRTAAFSGHDGTIYLWELATDRERCRFTHPGPVQDLAFSPDGRRLAAASLAAPVVVYDLYGPRGGAPRGR
jgi:RNA polymerase sigma factor (sigma-70 family)